ncbi:MAG: hypothetical protein WCK31_03035 [bacterium]
MKILVIGASTSGKTTLVKYLRSIRNDLPISEIDEELMAINKGVFPLDESLKKEVLTPKVIKDILNKENIIFFSNTDYFTIQDLKSYKDKGFKIVQLELSLDKLMERNRKRTTENGYPDISEYLPGMVEYQDEINKSGLVDEVIDANLYTEMIAKKILKL